MMASKISIRLVGSGGIQSPGRKRVITKRRNCATSTFPFLNILLQIFISKRANLLVMASRFSRMKTSLGDTSEGLSVGKLISKIMASILSLMDDQ